MSVEQISVHFAEFMDSAMKCTGEEKFDLSVSKTKPTAAVLQDAFER